MKSNRTRERRQVKESLLSITFIQQNIDQGFARQYCYGLEFY